MMSVNTQELNPKDLDQVFHALADPSRRAILAQLSLGRSHVTRIAEPFAMSLAAVSKHLKVLERSGLILRHKQGRQCFFELNATALKTAHSWLTGYEAYWQPWAEASDGAEASPEEKNPREPEPTEPSTGQLNRIPAEPASESSG